MDRDDRKYDFSEVASEMPTQDSIVEDGSYKLGQSPILKGMDKAQLKRLKTLGIKEKFSTDIQLIKEGKDANSFYIIKKGEVRIVKDGVTLGYRSAPEHIGVMPMIDGSKRSADVIAHEFTSVFKVPFKNLKKKKNADIYNQIVKNQLHHQQNELRRMNDATISEVKQKLTQARLKEESSKFFISLVVGLLIFEFILGSYLEWGDILKDPVIHQIMTPLIILGLALMSYYQAKKSGYSFDHFGVKWGNWKKDIPEALSWTAIFVIVMLGAKLLATYIPGTNYYGRPLFDTGNLLDFDKVTLSIIYISYVFIVPIQEFAARGVLQTELGKVLTGKNGVLNSILLASGLFSAFHLFQNMKFALLTFIPGIFWGYLFHKQKSLLGVTISHIIIGLLAITLLGVM